MSIPTGTQEPREYASGDVACPFTSVTVTVCTFGTHSPSQSSSHGAPPTIQRFVSPYGGILGVRVCSCVMSLHCPKSLFSQNS